MQELINYLEKRIKRIKKGEFSFVHEREKEGYLIALIEIYNKIVDEVNN